MKRMLVAFAAAVALLFSLDVGSAQQPASLFIRATTATELRTWDAYVTARERSRELQLVSAERDPSMPSRTVERLQQYHEGVPVWGAQVVRDSTDGVAESIFGEVLPSLTTGTAPALSADEAGRVLSGGSAALLRQPSLTVLRLDGGDARLAYTSVASSDAGIFRIFIDANTGVELLRYSEMQTQMAVGSGRGVNGDLKKMSTLRQGATYIADDQHRPPDLTTYDMRANFTRTLDLLNGFVP